jgi:hypothetical protein
MLDRFTGGAREAVYEGMAEARRLGATSVGPEHLLVGVAAHHAVVVGVLPFPTGVVVRGAFLPTNVVRAEDLRRMLVADDPEAHALAAIGISLPEVRQTLEETFGPDALSCDGRLPFRADAKRTLELALREAGELKRRRIGITELLLGLLRERSRASELLERLDVDPMEVYEQLRAAQAGLGALVR